MTMPIKTIPVLFVTFLFILTGATVSALFVDGINMTNVIIAVIVHVLTIIAWCSIYWNHKKETPVFGLSLTLWIIVTIIGYGLGVALPFFT